MCILVESASTWKGQLWTTSSAAAAAAALVVVANEETSATMTQICHVWAMKSMGREGWKNADAALAAALALAPAPAPAGLRR
jgi:hypothetical protein